MQLTLESPQIWVCNQAVDFRKSIDGLCYVLQDQFGRHPQDGIYVFYNRHRNKVKILGWHKNGFVLIYKRLEKGHFYMAKDNNGCVTLDVKQLSWLIAGLDWATMSRWNELTFTDFY